MTAQIIALESLKMKKNLANSSQNSPRAKLDFLFQGIPILFPITPQISSTLEFIRKYNGCFDESDCQYEGFYGLDYKLHLRQAEENLEGVLSEQLFNSSQRHCETVVYDSCDFKTIRIRSQNDIAFFEDVYNTFNKLPQEAMTAITYGFCSDFILSYNGVTNQNRFISKEESKKRAMSYGSQESSDFLKELKETQRLSLLEEDL